MRGGPCKRYWCYWEGLTEMRSEYHNWPTSIFLSKQRQRSTTAPPPRAREGSLKSINKGERLNYNCGDWGGTCGDMRDRRNGDNVAPTLDVVHNKWYWVFPIGEAQLALNGRRVKIRAFWSSVNEFCDVATVDLKNAFNSLNYEWIKSWAKTAAPKLLH